MQHEYLMLSAVVLAESIGLPVPAALGLIVAGGAGARGAMHPGPALLAAMAAMLIGDNVMFLMGRYTGWWLLSMLCRVSLNPEACILQSADLFYKRGRVMLIFAKFLPGINSMAPPLAGSMNMRLTQFFPLDFAGAALYVCAYFGAGYIFSDFLSAITRGYSTVGGYLGWILFGLFLIWFANRLRLWLHARKGVPVPMISPREAAANDLVAIFDVRSHGYYDENTMRIKGSHRLEPNALAEQLGLLPRDKEIVLYCTCLKEATAVRVARMLAERGIPSAVLEGGLSAWKKASLPLEPVPAEDIVLLPKFA
jgi:membrane protein DedA with SNARE-associated domain/rhodanese-related sulfurtransferase